MAKPTIRKKPLEEFPIGIRYHDEDLPTGVTVSSVTAVATPATLTIGTTGVVSDGSEVYAWVSGGTTDVDYSVRFTATLSDSKILIDDYIVKVRN